MSLPDVTVVTAGERRLADPVPTWAVVQGRPRFGADEELGVVPAFDVPSGSCPVVTSRRS